MLKLVESRLSDAKVLTEISKKAFESDILCGNSEVGGPPGYDSVQWHRDIINNPQATCFNLVLDEKVTGGAVVFTLETQGVYNLGRIWLDPSYHRRGLGQEAMKLVEAQFPDAKRWVLDTPAWNIRTRAFYQKLGYSIIKESDFLIFEKLAK